ncbi:MAG: hypothetical protein FD174_1996 [Geobacteraceae bacterium]|nr:MAG: hypothetical protein FD174_1996 [Geobacteraceae bacterium]
MKSDIFLADTTVWVHYLRGDDPAVRDRIVPLIMADRVMTADIIIMEILRGARSEKSYETLHNDFAALPRLEMDAKVWERAWKTGYSLRQKGINVPLADTLIAAIALEHSCVLLHNDRHFNMMAKATGLKEEALPVRLHRPGKS